MTDRTTRPLGFGRSAARQMSSANIAGAGMRRFTSGGSATRSTGAKRLTAPGSMSRTAGRAAKSIIGGLFK